ncbi:MAG: beta-ketoacyl-ACP synthase II [Clostridiaceae bacterium]
MKRRVVVTGMGAITPVGNNVEDFWASLKEGKNGIDFIKSFDTKNFKAKLAAEVKDFKPEDYLDRKEAKRMDRFCQFAIAASKQAIKDSNIDLESIDKNRFGVMIGSGIGGLKTMEDQIAVLTTKGPNRVSPLFIPMMISNMASGNTAILFGAKGTAECVATACATGTNAVGNAFRLIRDGYEDYMLTGGAEASITPVALAGFSNLTALCTSDDKERASIPFDKERSGFVMGEGSGVLFIESLESAVSRKAKIYGEIVGYGSTCDAYHMTAPAEGGEGAVRAIERALNDGSLKKEEVSYINAHGTSTHYNDRNETAAIKTVFGDLAYKIPVSSTKSMTGHLLGATGAIEAIVCIKALQDGFIPPTIGYKVSDEECDLDYVPNKGREKELKYAISTSLGFGGHNAVLAFKKWE